MTGSLYRAAALALLVAATGCAVAPAPKPSEYRAEALPALQVPGAWTAGEVSGAVGDSWLGTFGDARLEALCAAASLGRLQRDAGGLGARGRREKEAREERTQGGGGTSWHVGRQARAEGKARAQHPQSLRFTRSMTSRLARK